jgi:hypothetical protein
MHPELLYKLSADAQALGSSKGFFQSGLERQSMSAI